MKIYLLVYLLCFSSFGFSQIINKNYSWNDLETERTACKGINCMGGTYYLTHSYHLGKDTILNQKNYNVLIDTIYGYDYKHGDTIGFTREEMDSKKLFFFSKFHNKEILLYDFSLQVGNEFEVDNYWESTIFKVASVDSVDYLGVKRLTITLSAEYRQPIVWVEGIGSVQGLMYNNYHEGLLLCLHDNQNLIYKNTMGYDCFKSGFIDAINELEAKNTFIVFPNPTIDNVTIKGNEVIKTVEIFDLYGNKIYDDHPNIETTRIPLVKFKKGIYLMEINCQAVKLVIK